MKQLKRINLIKSISLIILLTTISISVSGCGKKTDTQEAANPIVTVKGKTIAESNSAKQQIEYPAIVSSGQEAKLVAKTNGTAKNINFELGDNVKIGDILIKIDDVNQGASSLSQGFSANQIRQAQLAAEQAETNKRNVAATTAENYKSAQIAYDTSQVAAEQARINLENKKQLFGQNNNDTQTNAVTAADSAANLCDTVISSINNIGGFKVQSNVNISYKDCLGTTDSQSYYITQNAFYRAENDYQNYQAEFSDTKSKVDASIKLIKDTATLVDLTKKLLEKSVACPNLTSATLSGFQSSVAAFQPQLNASLSQVNASRQALDNTQINNEGSLESLQKAYELALQQEKTAAQNLESLKATIKSQIDGADLQYRNALITLQGLYDSHLVIAPISGKITKKAVANGDTVSAGQILGAISQTEDIRLQFYVDQENLSAITVGLPVSIKNNDNKILPAKVVSVSPRADDLTKRFMIEVSPDEKDYESFVLGTVMSVLVDIEKKVTDQNSIIVPLSAVEIGQGANYIFTVKDNIAKKVEVKLIKVEGENAEIQTDLPAETIIVIDGNKLIQDGDQVSLTQ